MITPVSRPAVFSALARAPKYRTPLLWVSHVDSNVTADPNHLGVAFAIGRSFGHAVIRNKARRRLRAAFRDALQAGSPVRGAVLVRCTSAVPTASYAELVGAVNQCLGNIAKAQRATSDQVTAVTAGLAP